MRISLRNGLKGPWGLVFRIGAAAALLPGIVLLGGSSQGFGQAALGTRVEYRTTGLLPGSGPEEKASRFVQVITLDPTGTKLLYEEAREGSPEVRRVVLRADAPTPVVYELLDGNRYRESPGDLNQIQKERDLTEQNEIFSANQLPRKQRDDFYKENFWLKSDGTRVVKVEVEGASKFLDRDCDRVTVTENGRTIVQGDVAKLSTAGGGPFQLYRRLGAFSDEVLEKLSKVEGVLLRGKITVVTALRANEFEIEALKVEQVPVDPKIFEVTGRTKVEDPKEVACAQCGKPVDPKNPGGKGVFDGKETLFHDERCFEAYFKAYEESHKKKGGAGKVERPEKANKSEKPADPRS